jgi:hypothetical protein
LRGSNTRIHTHPIFLVRFESILIIPSDFRNETATCCDLQNRKSSESRKKRAPHHSTALCVLGLWVPAIRPSAVMFLAVIAVRFDCTVLQYTRQVYSFARVSLRSRQFFCRSAQNYEPPLFKFVQQSRFFPVDFSESNDRLIICSLSVNMLRSVKTFSRHPVRAPAASEDVSHSLYEYASVSAPCSVTWPPGCCSCQICN